MKRFFIFILLVALVGAGIVIYMMRQGHDFESILNTPDKYDLRIECSDVENLLLTTTVNATVRNTSDRKHEDITIRITGYDSDGIITKQKETTFLRVLGPQEDMMKPITLPAKTVSCDCIIISSNPN